MTPSTHILRTSTHDLLICKEYFFTTVILSDWGEQWSEIEKQCENVKNATAGGTD